MSNPITIPVPTEVENSRLDPFLEVPGVLYCVLGPRGLIVQTNNNWKEVLGYDTEDLNGQTVFDLTHPTDVEKTLEDEPWFGGVSGKSAFTVRCRHKDGSYRWFRWHTQYKPDLQTTFAVAIDVTTQTEPIDISSPGSHHRPRPTPDQILFEANPNPMWVYDRESLRFLEVNDAAIEHYGYSRSEFLSMTLLDIRPASDHSAVKDSVLRHTATVDGLTWTHLLKNGKQIRVEVLVRDIEYRGYNARLASVKDVTEQQKSRALLQHNNDVLEQRVAERTKQLVAANTELEAFCFSVSHDLRAPLRAIDGFSHSVIQQYSDALGVNGREDLERVRRASQKMSELIDALLGMARLTRQELTLQTVDLSAIAKQINEEFQAENPGRNVYCRIQPDMQVLADPRLMHLLIQNLFSNAWKFTSNQPLAEIVFEARQSGSELVYSIRDNGAGFDMAYSDKLFQPFQRLHHASEFPGNGVGLATVNRIVSRHGGRTFAHGLINHGATVYFTLSPSVGD